jgi:hypothetical protein
LIIRLLLYWWKDWMGELAMMSSKVAYFILMLGGLECLVAVLEKRRFSVRRPKKTVVLLASCSVL